MARVSWAILMAAVCLWSTVQAAPKKNKSDDKNKKQSDLIPIPDHLLETYNMPSGKFAQDRWSHLTEETGKNLQHFWNFFSCLGKKVLLTWMLGQTLPFSSFATKSKGNKVRRENIFAVPRRKIGRHTNIEIASLNFLHLERE